MKTRAAGATAEAPAWPKKCRELHNHHFDSTIRNDFSFRDDDVVVATYAKSGATWTQQIFVQLLFGPDPDLEVAEGTGRPGARARMHASARDGRGVLGVLSDQV